MKKVISILIFASLCCLSSYAQIAKCKGKYLGNIIPGSVPSNYTTLWNQATSENGGKWGTVESTQGTFNFATSDVAYNWAKNNNALYKYHNFVWGSQTPGWVASASTATIQTEIQNYIKAAASHYTPMGGLQLIDVLNEPVNTAMPGNMKAALTAGYQADPANAADKNNQYGWAIWPYQLARKAFPNTTLLINEYNVEMNYNSCRPTYEAIINAIKNAPNLTDGSKNLIDGVGLQCHGLDNLTATAFQACIDEIWTKTGLPVHITEFDQAANPNEAKQQTIFSSLIAVAWVHPHVAGITLWGYIQGTTWINGNGTTGAAGTDSGIQYANGTDRPALAWLKTYIASQPSLSCCPAPAPFGSCTAVAAPTVTSPVTYCQNATATTLTASGTALKWYTVATAGTALTAAPIPTTTATGTTTYYVSQTVSGSESPRASIAVTVNATPAAPVVTTPVNYNQGATATALTATGTALKWYTAATGGTALTATPVPSTTATGTTNYYVSQTTNTCESPRATIAVVVAVATNILPTVSITSPVNNASLAAGSITITASAADADGTVTKVDFYNGTTLIGTATTAPYSFTWIAVTAGSYTLTAKATDNKAGVTTSTAVAIVVAQTAIPITLKAGWNIIGCPISGSTALASALSSIWTNVVTVKNLDSFYSTANAPALNSLTTVLWGKGYMVNVTVPCTLDWIVR
jgi:GH35 family endo-1,4-beta-xylanase